MIIKRPNGRVQRADSPKEEELNKTMKNAENLRTEIIYRLKTEGITIGNGETLYTLRYDIQEPEERKTFTWTALLNELVLQSVQYGIDEVMEAAHIEKHQPPTT